MIRLRGGIRREGSSPRRLRTRILLWVFGALMALVTAFTVVDHTFRLRDTASARQAYRDPGRTFDERQRVKQAIRYRIAQLTRPDEPNAAVGNAGAASSRLIEAGLLYGRLALLEEADGNLGRRDSYMAQAVRLVRDGGDPRASPEHIRWVLERQGSGAR